MANTSTTLQFRFIVIISVIFCWSKLLFPHNAVNATMSNEELRILREEVREMYYHAYNNYLSRAYPWDELKPLSCGPRNRDTEKRGHLDDILGNFSLTLVDGLDTLVVFGDVEEFERGMKLLKQTLSFDNNVTVSVFETTIRVLGGLLSIHLQAERLQSQLKEPYTDEFLALAEDLGNRLMPAFQTPTGIPYSRVNLRYGVVKRETLETCTAGAGTLLLEFGVLSRLTGNYTYENAARKTLEKLYHARSKLDLYGGLINVVSGKWTRTHCGIGAGIDSFYEYLLKSYILFGDSEYLEMWTKSYNAVLRRLHRNGWYLDVNMRDGQLVKHWVDSLQAFWPGLQVLAGDIDKAIEMHNKLFDLWKLFGFIPESFNLKTRDVLPGMDGYPLRPEFVESTLFLYQATRNPYYLEVGKEVVHSLQNHTRVSCGFASVAHLGSKRLEDRMDSYFLSETLKYLYLLFDPNNTFNKGDHVFTTEGHPFPLSIQTYRPAPRQERNGKVWHASCSNRGAVSVEDFGFENTSLVNVGADVENDYASLKGGISLNAPTQFNLGEAVEIHLVNTTNATVQVPSICVRVNRPSLIAGDYFGTPATFGPVWNTTGIDGKIVIGSPFDGCVPLNNPGKAKDNIVLLERGNCMFVHKIYHAQMAGAKAVVIVNDQPSDLFAMAGEPSAPEPSIRIPSVLVSMDEGIALKENLQTISKTSIFAVEAYRPEFLKSEQSEVLIQVDNPNGVTINGEQLMYLISAKLGKISLDPNAQVIVRVVENIADKKITEHDKEDCNGKLP